MIYIFIIYKIIIIYNIKKTKCCNIFEHLYIIKTYIFYNI